MPYKPPKVHCKRCGGWVAELDPRTGRVARIRNSHNVPPPERPDWNYDDEPEFEDNTPAIGRAWCAKCKGYVEWPLGHPELRRLVVYGDHQKKF